ncbi:ABC transporter [Alicyclobacillaceae bacterium I2511]|jgi:ABC-2 type transport system permease protein|nr:ABC transporter [Alicyclobacillaceae bacterium I2511]
MEALLSATGPKMTEVLIKMQFARLRQSWRPYVIVSAVMPAGIVLLLHLIAPAMLLSARYQVILGAMVLSESIAGVVMLSQQLAALKASKALDHYRVLPISMSILVLSMTMVYSLFAWPGILLIGLEGQYLDHVYLAWTLADIPVFLLEGVALGSIGILVGLLAPDEGLAGLIGNIVMMGILFGGMVPIGGKLANMLLWILPSTYALHLLPGFSSLGTLQGGVVAIGLILYAGGLWLLATWFIKRPAS